MLIPAFSFASLGSVLALIQILFPNLFVAAVNYAVAGEIWINMAYKNSTRTIQRTIVGLVIALCSVLGILVLAIGFKQWTIALAGLVSTGLATLVSSILLYAAKGVLVTTFSHVHHTASDWSSLIRLQTVPFDRQPLWMKLASVATMPVYGLYLLLALPAKAILEVIKAISGFGSAMAKFLQSIMVISSAASVCSFFLSTLILFQLEFGLDGPLDLFMLGITCLFICILIAMLLMMGSPLVKVLDFIQSLGFISIAMIGFIAMHHVFPRLVDPLSAMLRSRYGNVVTGVSSYPWLAMVVAEIIIVAVCTMPWCRPFAGTFCLLPLGLWILGTDFQSSFYKEWTWWVGLLIPALCWFLTRNWKLQVLHASSITTAIVHHHAPAAHHDASHSDHGHGHGHGGGFPIKEFVAGLFAAIIVIILIQIWTNLNEMNHHRLPPPAFMAGTTGTSDNLPSASLRNFSIRQTVTNLKDFAILKNGDSDNEWEFQLDARRPWQNSPFTVSSGDEVDISATGLVCGGENLGCVGPNGQDVPAKFSQTNPQEFPYGDALCQALIGRIGSKTFQVGENAKFLVPEGIKDQNSQFMVNYRMPYLEQATGGFQVKTTIRRK